MLQARPRDADLFFGCRDVGQMNREAHRRAFDVQCAQHFGVQFAKRRQARSSGPSVIRADRPGCHQSFAPREDLRAGGRAKRGQDRLGIGTGVEHIDGRRRAVGILRPGGADQEPVDRISCSSGSPPVKHRTDLEQGQIGKAARLIARGGLQEAGQTAWAAYGSFPS